MENDTNAVALLQQAVTEDDDVELVDAILSDNREIISDCQYPLLHLACSKGSIDMVSTLIRYGADILGCDVRFRRPIHCAVRAKILDSRLPLVKLLLHVHARNKDLRRVMLARDKQGLTCLHTAASVNGNNEVVSLLLKYKASAEVGSHPKFTNLQTPLVLACMAGCLKTVQVLIRAKAYVNSSSNGQMVPLICAAKDGWLAGLKALVSVKANVNARDCDGMTAVHWCFLCEHAQCANWLVTTASASLTLRDKSGKTPSDFAPDLLNTDDDQDAPHFLNTEIERLENRNASSDEKKKIAKKVRSPSTLLNNNLLSELQAAPTASVVSHDTVDTMRESSSRIRISISPQFVKSKDNKNKKPVKVSHGVASLIQRVRHRLSNAISFSQHAVVESYNDIEVEETSVSDVSDESLTCSEDCDSSDSVNQATILDCPQVRNLPETGVVTKMSPKIKDKLWLHSPATRTHKSDGINESLLKLPRIGENRTRSAPVQKRKQLKFDSEPQRHQKKDFALQLAKTALNYRNKNSTNVTNNSQSNKKKKVKLKKLTFKKKKNFAKGSKIQVLPHRRALHFRPRKTKQTLPPGRAKHSMSKHFNSNTATSIVQQRKKEKRDNLIKTQQNPKKKKEPTFGVSILMQDPEILAMLGDL